MRHLIFKIRFKLRVRVAQPVEHKTEDFGEGVRVTP